MREALLGLGDSSGAIFADTIGLAIESKQRHAPSHHVAHSTDLFDDSKSDDPEAFMSSAPNAACATIEFTHTHQLKATSANCPRTTAYC